jgi:hypothetical protein
LAKRGKRRRRRKEIIGEENYIFILRELRFTEIIRPY